jgi:hypothetical protein
MSQNGKGDGRRPMSVTQSEYESNWELAFGKKTSKGGFTIVPPPKSKKRRELLEGEDIPNGGSGGCRTRHKKK